MCAIIAQFIRDLLDFADLAKQSRRYNERVYRLTVLTRLVRLINARHKKPVKMVEINNQRKAFLDMLAWSEESITDVRKPKS